MSAYVGQIILFGCNFAPSGFLACDGSLQPISQFEVLFQLIGTTYGGDGVNTFAVPDLRGRTPVHMGAGLGLSNYIIGQQAGAENVTLSVQQLPSHTHAIDATNTTASWACKLGAGNSRSPVGNSPAIESAGVTMPYSSLAPDIAMAGTIAPANNPASGVTGSSNPHNNMQPYLVMNYCIAWSGIFPSQS